MVGNDVCRDPVQLEDMVYHEIGSFEGYRELGESHKVNGFEERADKREERERAVY